MLEHKKFLDTQKKMRFLPPKGTSHIRSRRWFNNHLGTTRISQLTMSNINKNEREIGTQSQQ